MRVGHVGTPIFTAVAKWVRPMEVAALVRPSARNRCRYTPSYQVSNDRLQKRSFGFLFGIASWEFGLEFSLKEMTNPTSTYLSNPIHGS